MNQKPAIGRIVHYSPTLSDEKRMEAAQLLNKGCNGNKSKLPAIIVAVWSDTCVNLRVLCDGDLTLWNTSVNKGDDTGQWNWPVIE